MKIFNYQAKDKTGKVVRGKVEATSSQEAARLLRERGLLVISLTPERKFITSSVKSFTARVSPADVSIFTRQFSTMISAGLPITEALIILRSQSQSALSVIISQVLADVEGGSSLAAAMEKYPKAFTPVYTSLIRAGETGGVLDKILARLAENLENEREFNAKVKGALIYPTILIIGMLVVALIMMTFVVPKLTAIYGEFNVELPAATRILIAVSNFLQHFWWVVPSLVIAGVWAFRVYAKTPAGRLKVDGLKFKIPIMGPLQKGVILTEFSRTLGLLVGAGLPILQGLKIVADSVGNSVVTAAINRASIKVEKGFSLAYALSEEPEVFPPMLYQMLAVGEETGKVDETLLDVSHVFEMESGHAVKNLTTAIEPMIMIVMGIGVTFLIIAIIMPIFNLTSKF